MTSPRLSTVGAGSAIEKALEEILKLTEEKRAEAAPREVRAHVTFALQEAYRRVAELRAQPEQGRELEPEIRCVSCHRWAKVSDCELHEVAAGVMSDTCVKCVRVQEQGREVERRTWWAIKSVTKPGLYVDKHCNAVPLGVRCLMEHEPGNVITPERTVRVEVIVRELEPRR